MLKNSPLIAFKQVETQNEKIAMHQLRYDVYCEDKHYLDAKDYPNDMEHDEWDKHSVHFIAYSANGVIGTVRLVLDSPLGFPIEQHFGINTPKTTRPEFAEVSRLIVNTKSSRSLGFQVTNGLYRSMLSYSIDAGIKHWYAILDDRLLSAYRRFGFLFHHLAEASYCFGCWNSPCVLSLQESLTNLKANNPKLYDFLRKPTSNHILTKSIDSKNSHNGY